jgi:transposase
MLERAAVQTAVTVKIGIDQHAAFLACCERRDGMLPKPARKCTAEQLLNHVKELLAAGYRVVTCYEAGPCGYWLHRQLIAAGAENHVVVPQCWDRERKRVKTDRRDARKLCDALDRWLDGDKEAFSVVRVPSEREEQVRSIGRQRAALVKERQRCAVRGHGLSLSQGIQLEQDWWRPQPWTKAARGLPAWLREQLADWQAKALGYDEEVDRWTQRVLENAHALGVVLVKGVGELTTVLIHLEICDWSRFRNRRQIASYTGLCPSEFSSGTKRCQGSITKHGNPRIRHLLVEAVWRLSQYQPDYRPLKLVRAATSVRARKRAVVAVARRLAIDLWRIHTQQCTPETLGLKLA